jgi:YVTN family beta-propeller protein
MRAIGATMVGLFLVACGSQHSADGPHAGAGSTAAPESVAIAPITGDALYVVNGGDATVAVLDPTSGTLLGKIQLKNVSYPHHIYLSPDRSKLAIGVPGHDLSMGHTAMMAADAPDAGGHGGGGMHGSAAAAPVSTGGAVLVLDATTGAMVHSRRLDAPNHNAVFSPDGREIWTALLRDDGAVLVLDADTLETKATIAVGRVPAEVTFTPDGRYVFVANGTSDDVTVIDPVTRAVVKTIAVDREPVGAWPGADGMMYVDCEVAKTLKAIDPRTLEVVRTYELKFTPGFAAVPKGRDGELWITDTEAGKVVLNRTTADERFADVATAEGAHALAFTPDGKTAFVTNQHGESVSIIDASTRVVRATVPVGLKPNGIVFRAH